MKDVVTDSQYQKIKVTKNLMENQEDDDNYEQAD